MKKGLIILIVLIAVLFLYKSYDYKSDRLFLNSLKGEIVYVHRDEEILNVYKISANGRDKKLLYHNEDRVNSNCLLPLWSKDGSKIYFAAMKNGEWKKFSMNSDGSNVTILENEEPSLTSFQSRANDIVIKRGSVYYVNEDGKKIRVYFHKFFVDEFNMGADYASWSPDKKFIIFDSGNFLGPRILIANREGTRVVEITKGHYPDWKY